MSHRTSEFNKRPKEMEKGRDIWELNCKKSVYVNNTEDNCKELANYFSDGLGVQLDGLGM